MDLKVGDKVWVTINKTARKEGIKVKGVILYVGERFSLVQLEHYKETFWNDEIEKFD